MIKEKETMVIAVIMLTVIVGGIIIVVDDSFKDETERFRYSESVIVDDMCYEEYNKSYDECNYTEKKQIIRKYRLTLFEHEHEKPSQIIPLFIPT